MRDVGLVIDEKLGYDVHYRLNKEALGARCQAIDRLLAPTIGTSKNKKGAKRCAVAMRRSKAAGSRST